MLQSTVVRLDDRCGHLCDVDRLHQRHHLPAQHSVCMLHTLSTRMQGSEDEDEDENEDEDEVGLCRHGFCCFKKDNVSQAQGKPTRA